MKNRKETLIDKIKCTLEPSKIIFHKKYNKKLKNYFISDENDLKKKKEELNMKIEDQLQKLGKITMKMILNIDKESAKRLQASEELEYCAGIIESEAIYLRDNYYK